MVGNKNPLPTLQNYFAAKVILSQKSDSITKYKWLLGVLLYDKRNPHIKLQIHSKAQTRIGARYRFDW